MVQRLFTVRDPYKNARPFWLLVCTAVDSILLLLGGGFAFSANVTTSPSFQILAHLPGGLRTHGSVMLVLALVNTWALAAVTQRYTPRAWRWLRWSSIATLFWTSFSVLALAGAQTLGAAFDGQMLWYLLAAVLVLGAMMLPPPLNHPGTMTVTELAEIYARLAADELAERLAREDAEVQALRTIEQSVKRAGTSELGARRA